MAFEAYLQHQTARPRLGRRVTAIVSVAAHALALAIAIAYSYWHVEELRPPRVEVTLMSAAAAPPPPPPPAPLGGGAPTPAKHKVTRPKVEVKPTELVQPKKAPDPEPDKADPKEPPKEEPKVTPPASGNNDAPAGPGTPDGVKGGVAGGVAGGTKGGVAGGVVGGTGTEAAAAPVPAKFLPPAMGSQQKLSGADPDFPPHLRRPGVVYVVMAKITVNAAGVVDSVVLQKRAEPTLDELVVAAVKKWRFRPLLANGKPIPFSYFGRFEFKSE